VFALVRVGDVPADKHESAPQFRPVRLGVQLTRLDRGTRVVGLDRLPGARVPDDDVTRRTPWPGSRPRSGGTRSDGAPRA